MATPNWRCPSGGRVGDHHGHVKPPLGKAGRRFPHADEAGAVATTREAGGGCDDGIGVSDAS